MNNLATEAERKLAFEISNCPLVSRALSDKSLPCHKVVDWQASQWNPKVIQIEGSPMHRPEPWTGLLSKAPIMFVASNPSFDRNEHFPNWNWEIWKESDIAEFGAQRFTNKTDPKFGATDSESRHGADRTVGKNGEISGVVKHWEWVRKIAALVLNKAVTKTSAITDYVMTEFVHCKSPKEQGVWADSLGICSSRYFEKILELSPAKLIFIAGVKTGRAFAENYPDLVPDSWGSWSNSNKGKGAWPQTSKSFADFVKNGKWTLEIQKQNTFTAKLGGQERTFVYLARPGGGGGLYAPWVHKDLIHPELLKIWRNQLQLS